MAAPAPEHSPGSDSSRGPGSSPGLGPAVPRTAAAPVGAPHHSQQQLGSALAALVTVQLCYGLFPAAVLMANQSFSPRAIFVWRIATGAVVLGGLAVRRHGRRVLPRRADLGRLALCAFLGVVANQVLALEGMSRSSSANAGLLMTLIPVFTYGLAVAVRQERLTGRRAVGLALALTGALLVAFSKGGGPELRQSQLLGAGLIALNCLSYSSFLLLSRGLLQRYPPSVLIALIYWFALLAVPIVGGGEVLLPDAPTHDALAGLAYTLVFPTVVAYLLNMYALARVPASTTAIFIYLQPLVAGAAGWLVLGEVLQPVWGAALVIVFVGIALVVRRAP